MNQNERYNKTTEIIGRFTNGERLYKHNALFNTSIQAMVEGASIYDIVENLLEACDNTNKAFEQYMLRSTTHIPAH